MEKRVSDSLTEQVYIIRPQHINPSDRLFGGQLMLWIDEMAGVVSRRHSNSIVTTASIDNLNFLAAAYQDDMIVLVGKVTHVGKTSMEIRVDSYIEDYSGNRTTMNRAYVVMVAVDEDGRPTSVPGLILETDEEREEWEAAERRNAIRKERREQGY
ncbi:MAG: acyl-CoA thioesterase [Atopobiaceae bacterium]|nr:acyl-CoA thioesterase [Atopobiaceae bacterium]